MHGKLLGLMTVVVGRGEEFDIGELVTYLNDAVLIARRCFSLPRGRGRRSTTDPSISRSAIEVGR
jgi:hypothetical protein